MSETREPTSLLATGHPITTTRLRLDLAPTPLSAQEEPARWQDLNQHKLQPIVVACSLTAFRLSPILVSLTRPPVCRRLLAAQSTPAIMATTPTTNTTLCRSRPKSV